MDQAHLELLLIKMDKILSFSEGGKFSWAVCVVSRTTDMVLERTSLGNGFAVQIIFLDRKKSKDLESLFVKQKRRKANCLGQ